MSSTGLEVFDTTLHKTNEWLKRIMGRLATEDRHVAYLGLRATLHALRDRLPPELAVHLGAQLPLLVRGVYYEGWRLAATPSREHQWDEFLDHVRRELPGETAGRAQDMVEAVFAVIAERVDGGEVRKVVNSLPRPLRAAWPDGAGGP